MAMHRCTIWYDASGSTVQVSVACLSDDWEPAGEVTLNLGPFDDRDEALASAMTEVHRLVGYRAHQTTLFAT